MNGKEFLELLRGRRSVRAFTGAPVERATLERLMSAAITAPSSSNRQPWRFDVVEDAPTRARIAAAVRERAAAIRAVIDRGPHAAEFGGYSDHFWEPLAAAAVIVIPQTRDVPDPLAALLRRSGADPEDFALPGAMSPELCGVAAAVMALLLQARVEGLGACWMAGPMVARPDVERMLDIAPPWRMVGAIALGHPAEEPAPTARKPTDLCVRWR